MKPYRALKLTDFTRWEIIAILIAVAVVVGVTVVQFTFAGAYVRANMGFGPEWVCSNPYNKGPVCIKKRPAGDLSPTAN